jgi:hypothetical protein
MEAANGDVYRMKPGTPHHEALRAPLAEDATLRGALEKWMMPRWRQRLKDAFPCSR